MGAEVGGVDGRAEVQSKGRIGGVEVGGCGAAGTPNRRRGRSSGGWMEAARCQIPGAATALFSSPISSLSLLLLSCVLQGWGAPAREEYELDFLRAQLLFLPSGVHLDQSDARSTPWRVRRCHSQPSRGERDAPIGKTP